MIIKRSSTSSVFSIPIDIGVVNAAGFGNFIYPPAGGSITSSKFIVSNQTSSAFLKGDGSVDTNTYLSISSRYIFNIY